MANQLIGKLSVSGGSAPVLDTLNVTTNGTYTPPTGTDGYNEVNVNVSSSTPVLDTLSVTTNGTYTPPTGTDGYNEVNVNVPSSTPVLDTLSVTANGTYTPPTGTDGYNEVNVNVPSSTPVLTSITITENGRYYPPSGVDGYNDIRVSIHDFIADGNSVLFFDSTHGLVVSFYSENVNSVENLSSHYNNSKFYNVFKDRQVWCKVYEDVDATEPLGYIGFYQNTIRAWDLTLSQNINIEGAYGSIVLSDDTQQQDNNGCILF
jgi:hypothetical protein